jgi:hypothetical protein
MGKIVHIGAVDPEVGHGGVEQFARDLRDTFGEVEFLNYHVSSEPPWVTARRANEINLVSEAISEDDIVIADGYYGLGLAGKVKRLIIVCHGSYAGMLREFSINPTPSYGNSRAWLLQAEKAQARAYFDGEVVSVSQHAAMELKEIYDLDSTVILNGVDASEFCPGTPVDGRVFVEVAGGDERKGCDTIEAIKELGIQINTLGYDGKSQTGGKDTSSPFCLADTRAGSTQLWRQ